MARGPNGVQQFESPSTPVTSPGKCPSTVSPSLPEGLASIRDDFLALGIPDRLQLLLEYSDNLPEVPEGTVEEGHWEKVEECQSPVFISVLSTGDEVTVLATAPPEAPTTRGFASILVHGLKGMTRQQILDTPPDFPLQLGLQNAVSMLRLRGMSGMLWRIKRQVESSTSL